jgi:multidrug efflux system membrane fusion protein
MVISRLKDRARGRFSKSSEAALSFCSAVSLHPNSDSTSHVSRAYGNISHGISGSSISTSPPRRRIVGAMRNKIAIISFAIVAAGGIWAIRSQLTDEKAVAQTGPAGAVAGVPVTAGVAEARDMPIYLRGIGAVQAYNHVTLKSRVDGQIVQVSFTEGQKVKAGDLLFQLDPRPFQAALAQASAAREKDEAQLASALADLKRHSELLTRGFQTQQVYDQQKALVGQIQASIKADQAQIDTAQLNLHFTDVRSPIDGRTGARLVDIGNLVRTTDAGGLVMITQMQPIFVTFTLPQSQLNTLRQSEAEGPIEVQAYSDSEQKALAVGKLTLIDNQIDSATGTIRLKGTFENADEVLWPGAFVNIRLVTGIKKNAVTVPARAIQQGPSGSFLFVIKADQSVEMRTVKVLTVEQDVAVIDGGLAAGENIVVDGQYRLEAGTKVRLQTPRPNSGT